MSDIVARLRERARGGFAHDELDEEAADEIERLRAQSIEDATDHNYCMEVLGTEKGQLRAEIERLRAAIEWLNALLAALEPKP